MARVVLTIEFDSDHYAEDVEGILDEAACRQPGAAFGVEVDGEHRDPDEPTSGLLD